MENIIVIEEKVILPETPLCEQTVTIPCIKGDKGDKGDPFTYEDFTPEQIKELQKPATDAGAVALAAANKANAAADKANQAADINMDEYVGRVIKGDFGYIQIPNPNLGNGKLLYPRYKKFN